MSIVFNPDEQRSLYRFRQEKYQKKRTLSSHPKLEDVILIRHPKKPISKTSEKMEKPFYYNDFCEIPSVNCFFSIISSFSTKEDQLKKKKLTRQLKIDMLNRLRDERCSSNNTIFSEKNTNFSGKSIRNSGFELPSTPINPIAEKSIGKNFEIWERKKEGKKGEKEAKEKIDVKREGEGGGRVTEREIRETESVYDILNKVEGEKKTIMNKKSRPKIYPTSLDFWNLKLTEREIEKQMLRYVTRSSKPPKQLHEADILLNSSLFKHSKTIDSAFETYLNRFSVKDREDDIKSALVRTERKISEGVRRIEEIESGRKRGKSKFGREI